VQSTDGSESSHSHFPGDLSYERGYEYKLMQMAAARERNPRIKIYALQWSVPGWVGGDTGNDYSAANIQYTLSWLLGAKQRWNCSVDMLGFSNEPHELAPIPYIKAMRAALDGAGFAAIELIAFDASTGAGSQLALAMTSDTVLRQAVHAFGFHGGPTEANAQKWLPSFLKLDPKTRPKIWASEDRNVGNTMAGARSWARVFSNNWLNLNVTATVRWSLIWSVYPGADCDDAGTAHHTPYTIHHTLYSHTICRSATRRSTMERLVPSTCPELGSDGPLHLVHTAGRCDTPAPPRLWAHPRRRRVLRHLGKVWDVRDVC
jgi:galactosylceramidase